MAYLHKHDVGFAIVSGGHGTATGASNVDAGVTIDLSALSAVSVASDKSLVSIGSGARWEDVYKFLDPTGITIAGARAGTVGAGGFLLGGGVSTLATKHGWSCDMVAAIDLILANGTHLTASETQAADLFEALKGGGANFAVPWRFDMQAFPLDDFHVIFIQYEWSQVQQLMGKISKSVQNWTDLDSTFDLSLAISPATGEVFANLMLTRFGPIRDSPLLKTLLEVPHASILNETFTPGTLAAEIDRSNPAGYRQDKWTLTIQNDEQTAMAIAQEFANFVAHSSLPADPAYRPGMLFQAISRAQLGRRDNALGLENDTSPLLLISFENRWSLSENDQSYQEFSSELQHRCRRIAEEHGALHPFIYLNYAAAGQDPFSMLRQDGRLERLKDVRSKYDGSHFLERRLQQPLKLGP